MATPHRHGVRPNTANPLLHLGRCSSHAAFLLMIEPVSDEAGVPMQVGNGTDRPAAGELSGNTSNGQDQCCSIEVLPPELLPLIIRFLPLHGKYGVQRVSRTWNEASKLAVKRQEHLVVRNTNLPNADGEYIIESHELPIFRLVDLSRQSATPADLISGLRILEVVLEASSPLRYFSPDSPDTRLLCSILKDSCDTLVRMSVPSGLLSMAADSGCVFKVMHSLSSDSAERWCSGLASQFPRLQKLRLCCLDLGFIRLLPASLESIEAGEAKATVPRGLQILMPALATKTLLQRLPCLHQVNHSHPIDLVDAETECRPTVFTCVPMFVFVLMEFHLL